MSDSIPAPRYGLWQSIGVAIRLGARALDEVRALKAAPPPVARFPVAKPWAPDVVHYAGDVVTDAGATWQALRDTARVPGEEDWLLIAAAGIAGQNGRDGEDPPIGEVYGRFDPARAYKKFDLVAHEGCEWRAKCDNPGPIPGDGHGWAMSAARGGQGKRGEQGERGPAGARITALTIDGYQLAVRMSDGSAATVDLRPMFERYDDEVRR